MADLLGQFHSAGLASQEVGDCPRLFVVAVTALVHAPALLSYPPTLPEGCLWMWDILQRSNFVKNLCLLGVCFHLLHHEPGKLSLAAYLQRP